MAENDCRDWSISWYFSVTELELFEYGAQFSLDFFVWGWTKSVIEKRKETICWLVFCILLPAQKNVKTNSNEKHASFAHKLQSELRLTVGLSKICCEQ